jgi:hypothetical protein
MKKNIIKFPFVVEVRDYHSFYYVQDFLRDLTGNSKIKVVELVYKVGEDDDFSDDQLMIYWKRRYHRVPEESPINDARIGSIASSYIGLAYEGKQPDIKDIIKSRLVIWE